MTELERLNGMLRDLRWLEAQALRRRKPPALRDPGALFQEVFIEWDEQDEALQRSC